jgi:GntR family transcriptional regulator/MocR family aminotransferase
MPKTISSFEVTLKNRPQHQTLTKWLYGELRNAILEGRLESGARLPASRDFARQYGLSRGTVVSVFERLQDEGYISSRVGFGTLVNRVVAAQPNQQTTSTPPAYVRNVISAYVRPKPYVDLVWKEEIRPFRAADPAITEFPAEVWGADFGKARSEFQIMA